MYIGQDYYNIIIIIAAAAAFVYLCIHAVIIGSTLLSCTLIK
jgi:hypothetical protein